MSSNFEGPQKMHGLISSCQIRETKMLTAWLKIYKDNMTVWDADSPCA